MIRSLNYFEKRNLWFAFFAIVCGYLFLGLSLNVYADDSIVNKQLDTKDFVLDVSIDKSKIRDGTPDFDADDDPGHDSSAHNSIVRTKDTVIIPLKLTINPKKDTIKNITLKTTVKIQNDGLDGLREVYTTETSIKQTSTAVYMDLPFVVPFRSHNFDLNPEIDVEIIKVNGEKVEPQKVTFNDFFHLKISAKANIGYDFRPVIMASPSMIHGGDVRMNDFETLFMSGIRFFSDLEKKGSTFPKNVRMEIKTDGSVNYDLDKYQDLAFDNTSSPIHGFDVHSFNKVSGGVDSGLLTAKSHSEASKRGSRYMVSSGSSYNMFFISYYYSLDRDYCGYDLRIIPTNNNSFIFELSNLHVNSSLSNNYFTGSNTKIADIGFIEYLDKDFRLGGRDNKDRLNNTEFYRLISHLQLNNDASFHYAYKDKENTQEQIHTVQRRNFDSQGSLRGHGYWSNYADDLYRKYFYKDRLTGNADFNWDFDFGNRIFEGGFDLLIKFNPDSFKKDRGNHWSEFQFYHNKRIRYGIAKDSNNEFKHFIHKEKDDYIWYDNYYDDEKHGRTSAVLYEVMEPNFLNKNYDGYDLHMDTVLTYDGNRFGTTNDKDTYNLAQGIMYLYEDKDRKQKPIVYGSPNEEGRFNNPWMLDEQLNTLKPQSPKDDLSTFDTIKVRPMNVEVRANIGVVNENYMNKVGEYHDYSINGGNMYTLSKNNDVSHLEVGDYVYTPISMRVTYPKMYGLDGKNNVLELEVTAPKGLTYVENSIHSVDDENKSARTFLDKPSQYSIKERIKLPDGSEKFIFNIVFDQSYFFSNATINDVVYQGVMHILGMKFKVTSAFFDGSDSFSTRDFTIKAWLRGSYGSNHAVISGNRLYLLSVLEEIESKSQKRNQPFSIAINPFTTNERENNVRGAFHVPANNDENGSHFAGELHLKNIDVKTTKLMNIYVNKQRLDVSNVLNIDISRDGWVKYVDGMDLNGIQSVYYEIPGQSTISDDLHLKLNFETKGNHTGDTYIHTSYVNSDNRYRIPPKASKVSYVVDDVPPLKVDFSKIQIRTKPKEEGLDVDVYTNKAILDDSGKEVSFKVELWDNTLNQKVTEKDYTGDSLPEKIAFKVPSELLKQDGQQHNYEVRLVGLEGSDAKINTDGYTSSKKIVRLDDLKDHLKDDTYVYRSVIMTERYKGNDIKRYYEEIKVPIGKPYRNKTGYAIDLKPFGMSYQNDLQEFDSISGVKVELSAEKGLVEKANIKAENWFSKHVELQVERTSNVFKDNKISFDVELPEVSARQNDGAIHLAKNVKTKTNYYNGGRRLYVPIWTKLKNYELVYDLSDHKIGVNQVSLTLIKHVDVYAYMYNPSESTSVINDELMLKPNMQR